MKIFIKFCIISLTVLSSCKKDINSPYTFSGKVTDKNGNAIANATISLSAYYRGNILSGGGYSELSITTTDNSGNFNTSFNYGSSANNFMIQVFANNYYPDFNVNIFQENIRNKTLSQNLILYKLSTIKINFKNSSPVSSNDEFSFFQTNEVFGPTFYTFIERQFTGGTYNELENKYVGSSVQGYVITKTKGDTYTVINWTSNKNGVLNYKQDSIFIKGGEQGNYSINY